VFDLGRSAIASKEGECSFSKSNKGRDRGGGKARSNLGRSDSSGSGGITSNESGFCPLWGRFYRGVICFRSLVRYE
jgi:hypothetical protein